LGTYAAGIGIPFILAAFVVGAFMRFMRKFRRYMGIVEKAMGGFLILTGILLITDNINVIAQWMIDTFPFLSSIG
jgi:cytochrome c-type biogenesis protein